MIIIREVLTAKPGMASKLAKMMKGAFKSTPNSRVLTDLVGNYNTVVVETEMSSLMDFEKMMEEYKSGKPGEMGQSMAGYTDMYLTGRREIYQVTD